VRVPFTHALAFKALVKREEKKREIIMLVESLRGGDIDLVVEAAGRLGMMGEDALPDMLALVKSVDLDVQLSRRALTVLLVMDWESFGKEIRNAAVEVLSPMLMRIDGEGRTSESHLAEMVMLNMGDESIPAFLRMLRNASSLPRMLALSALLNVDWKGIEAKVAMRSHEALRMLESSDDMTIKKAAKELLIRIERVHARRMDDGMPLEVV
jgi:hypothetical protein